MNVFKVKIEAHHPSDAKRASLPVEVLVDTCSELTWLPRAMLESIGVQAGWKQAFPVTNHLPAEREIGLVTLQAHGHVTKQEVVFAEPGDPPRLGLRALQGFGVKVDDAASRFVSMSSLIAFCGEHHDAVSKAA